MPTFLLMVLITATAFLLAVRLNAQVVAVLGMLGGFLQTQLAAFGETLKKSLREMRLTVSWQDGKTSHGFTVTTHLLVLNPRAPGGARGDNPEVPPNLAAAGALKTLQQQQQQQQTAKPGVKQ